MLNCYKLARLVVLNFQKTTAENITQYMSIEHLSFVKWLLKTGLSYHDHFAVNVTVCPGFVSISYKNVLLNTTGVIFAFSEITGSLIVSVA